MYEILTIEAEDGEFSLRINDPDNPGPEHAKLAMTSGRKTDILESVRAWLNAVDGD